jgi:hypothetical protein
MLRATKHQQNDTVENFEKWPVKTVKEQSMSLQTLLGCVMEFARKS